MADIHIMCKDKLKKPRGRESNGSYLVCESVIRLRRLLKVNSWNGNNKLAEIKTVYAFMI